MLHEKQTSNGGKKLSNKNRMARRANGLDLSDAVIIVDKHTIKNTRTLRKFFLTPVFSRMNHNQARVQAC